MLTFASYESVLPYGYNHIYASARAGHRLCQLAHLVSAAIAGIVPCVRYIQPHRIVRTSISELQSRNRPHADVACTMELRHWDIVAVHTALSRHHIPGS